MSIEYILIFLSIVLVFIYAVLKEREESGCKKCSIKKHSSDYDSVYVNDTNISPKDSLRVLFTKLKNIFNYELYRMYNYNWSFF